MQGSAPVTGKMPVPQVLLLKGQHYIIGVLMLSRSRIVLTTKNS